MLVNRVTELVYQLADGVTLVFKPYDRITSDGHWLAAAWYTDEDCVSGEDERLAAVIWAREF